MNEIISAFSKDGLVVVIHLTGTPSTAKHCAFVSGPDFIRVDEISQDQFAFLDKEAANRASNIPPYGQHYAAIYYEMIK